jgi:hypothetical protein
MVSRDDEPKYECQYIGPTEATVAKPVESEPVPPKVEVAKMVALRILTGVAGMYRPSKHARERMTERDFDIFDIQYVIRNGRCVGDGVYSREHRDFEYTFRGNIDGTDFDAAISLSAEHHFIESPLMIILSGVWKTKTGKRKKTY